MSTKTKTVAEATKVSAKGGSAREQNATSGKNDESMDQLIKDAGSDLIPFKEGQVVEAEVVQASANKVWLDIRGLARGVVPDKELSVLSLDLEPGDKVSAYILILEDAKGNMVLSLRKADQERLSDDLKHKYQEGEIINVKVKEANKGGLLIEIGDYQGFLPVSQLASKNYPRVDGGDPDKIYSKLKDLIGKTLKVKIISFDSNQNKLIFSEKAAGDEDQEKKLAQIKEGETIEGTVTGIVDFGIFVKIGRGESEIEGLVHISEIAWGRVNNLSEMYKVGDKVKVLIVSTEDNRVSLSMKRLQTDPWRVAAKKYKVNNVVQGEVTKITDYGLFVRIDSEIDGLVHLSEINSKEIEEIAEKYETGKVYSFRIISFDPDAHRLGLSLKLKSDNDEKKPEKKEEKDKKAKAEKVTNKASGSKAESKKETKKESKEEK